MSSPPENRRGYPQGRQSAPASVVYGGAFFSGAHHFEITGGEYSNAENVYRTVTNDNSFRSNFNNQRTEDRRGSSSNTNNFQGEYNDNRLLRSQTYDARYTDAGQYGLGRGSRRPRYSPYVEDYDDDDEYYGPRRRNSSRGSGGGYGYGPGYRPRRRYDEYDDDYEGYDNRGNNNEPPRMIESRETVRQRERATFDATYFTPESNRSSRSGRGHGDVHVERELEMASDSRTYQQEPQSYAYQAEPESPFRSGPGSGNNNRNNGYASPAPAPGPATTSRYNPFRAATTPIPRPDNFGPSADARSPPNRWVPEPRRRPPPSVEEVDDVEDNMDMQGVEGGGDQRFEREEYREWLRSSGGPNFPRQDPHPRSNTTGPNM